MTKDFDRKKKFYHKDPWYGRNDWEAVVAYVRALLENSEDQDFCWPRAEIFVLEDNSLLSQTFIQQFGKMRDVRGIGIIREKLKKIGPEDMTIQSPWCPEQEPLEYLSLQSLAKIGGSEATKIIENYRKDPAKTYLFEELKLLEIGGGPRLSAAPCPKDYPEILKGIRSYHDVLGEGGNEDMYSTEKAKKIMRAFHSLKWPGDVEMLSGDGETTTFKLNKKITDHIHNHGDPFGDFAIFLSNPKMEYPLGKRRWTNSHTFLYFPVADGSLYGKEYTWNLKNNTITTYFHEHVPLKQTVANDDGKSITVNRTPISTGVEVRGNVSSKKCNSAVRGVWDNPQKRGKNYYVRRANILTTYKKLYYFAPLAQPIVNQLGIWLVHEDEKTERFFDTDGNCSNVDAVIEQLLIPLHEPKILSWNLAQYIPKGPNDKYASRINDRMKVDLTAVPDVSTLDGLIGIKFEHSKCGNAGAQMNNDNGYRNGFDFNCNGVIDEQDREILAAHTGEVYRMNIGDYGYFGLNWLSTGNRARSQSLWEPLLFVCCDDYGAGYEPDTGKINLFEPVKPGSKMYVEYFCDVAPAEGKDNIKVYLHPEIE